MEAELQRRELLKAHVRAVRRGTPDRGEAQLVDHLLDSLDTARFPHAVDAEWEYVPGRSDLGRGDLVFSDRSDAHRPDHEPAQVLVIEAKWLDVRTGRNQRTDRTQARRTAENQVRRSMEAWHNRHPNDTVWGCVYYNTSAASVEVERMDGGDSFVLVIPPFAHSGPAGGAPSELDLDDGFNSEDPLENTNPLDHRSQGPRGELTGRGESKTLANATSTSVRQLHTTDNRHTDTDNRRSDKRSSRTIDLDIDTRTVRDPSLPGLLMAGLFGVSLLGLGGLFLLASEPERPWWQRWLRYPWNIVFPVPERTIVNYFYPPSLWDRFWAGRRSDWYWWFLLVAIFAYFYPTYQG